MKIEVKKTRRKITIRKLLKCGLIKITELRFYNFYRAYMFNIDNFYYFICPTCLQEHFLDPDLTKNHNHDEIRKKSKLNLLLCCACFDYQISIYYNNMKEGAQE